MKKNIKNNTKDSSFEENLKAALIAFWGEDESNVWTAPGQLTKIDRWILAFKDLVDREIIKDEENCIKVIIEEKYFTVYKSYIDTFLELREEMIGDTDLWSIETKDEFEFLDQTVDETTLKEYLTFKNWFISNGVAIRLNDEVLSPIFIRCRDKILELESDIKRRKEDLSLAKQRYITTFDKK